MDENTKGRHVQPSGYNPTRITEPPAIPGEALAVLELTEAHEEIGLTRMLHATGALSAVDVQAMLAGASAKVGRALRLLTVGALALLVVGGVTLSGGGRAEAMGAPQPDPVVSVAARTVPVVLGAVPVTVYVRAAVYTETAPGWWCGSVFTARGRIGGTCSISPTFPIPVRIDPRTFPVGRSLAQVVDDATDVAVSNVIFDARRPSRFAVGTFLDMGCGDLYVRVPVTLYSPALGRWVPQVQSPVQIQELVGGAWRVRATLTTNPPGLAVGIVHLGGGRHVIRVVRPRGATVWGTTGRVHVFNLLTEPIDIV